MGVTIIIKSTTTEPPKSVMVSCRNSSTSKLLWLTLLPASMKKIHSKFEALKRSQHFSHYKSMGNFSDAQGQVTHKSLIGSCQIANPSEIIWVSLLPARMKKIQSTSSPMGNDRSPEGQHNVWRHHNLQCSKADNSELETVTRN